MSLRAINREHSLENDQRATQEIAIVGVKTVTEISDVVIDMRSAVYMYHLVQSLVKFADNDDAHKTYVGESRCQS